MTVLTVGHFAGLGVGIVPKYPTGFCVGASLSVGDASIYIYRHESLTPEQVLNLLIESYKAWAVNQPGGRR